MLVADITYIPTKEGWLYLTVVIVLVPAGLHDIYSRKAIGWSMRYSLHTSLVNDVLLMAIKSRNPNKELIYHRDRGSQMLLMNIKIFWKIRNCSKYE